MRAPTVRPNTGKNPAGRQIPRRESGRPSGWHRYLELLVREGVAANARCWYVQRAEDFVAAMRPKRLSELTVEEITAFFPRYARDNQLTDGQFRQTVDALQLLLVDLAQAGAAREVDWEHLRESGRALESAHPTRAAAMSPEAAVAGHPVYQRAAAAQPLLQQLARTLRAERYALRTEQT
ncbi:hypothetical protein CKO31_24925 [Thiohalocapsa halophila]|uniref:Integrase SAM-like N-terminal domain-containing protein n=1 Tax=Thiohalocapsa halophila TaxID=69359 RepID=A0ABS1CPQ7_9GAMM|nr:hypothetical protein [Thiohalocapsa halophila]MBK1633915.1 hypothetical protein [Thiohalocapsa halophila]